MWFFVNTYIVDKRSQGLEPFIMFDAYGIKEIMLSKTNGPRQAGKAYVPTFHTIVY